MITIKQLDVIYTAGPDAAEDRFAELFEQCAARRESQRRRDREDEDQAGRDSSPLTGGSW